ncbi:MAG: DUF1501 domain-containing protein [Actinobacteria bacterium]|nr:DUF1501 domain-containing protein [Actinomycetota bacterium]
MDAKNAKNAKKTDPSGESPPRRTARPELSRRTFLGITGGAAVAAAGGGLLWNALVREHLEDAVSSGGTVPATSGVPGSAVPSAAATAGKTLVVLQLAGGNDGLNTLVPGNDGSYFDSRPTLRVEEGEIVKLDGAAYGLHPKLQPLVPLWDGGRLVAVDAVGFLQGQSRSHFQAMDLWWSATPGQARTTGWLGRYLDQRGDPTNPLRAISLGAGSPALVGDNAMSTAVRDPQGFDLLAPKGADAAQLSKAFAMTAEPLANDPDLAAAQQSIPSALRAVDLLKGVAAAPAATQPRDAGLDRALRAQQGGRGEVAELLDVAAGIIDLQIGTEIIVVGVSGYDTHSNQAAVHPQLLDDLAQGVSGFLAAVDKQGRSDRVLVMTTSEFGRRVQENGSGTDHGEGGVQFLAGTPVRGKQIIGDANLGQLDNGDVKSTVETRSLYAAALDWLAGEPDLTDGILGGSFDRLGLVA